MIIDVFNYFPLTDYITCITKRAVVFLRIPFTGHYPRMEKSEQKKISEASIYHKVSNFQFEDALKLLEFLSPQANDSILDIGCGTGRLAEVFSQVTCNGEGKVLGIDPDEERIRIAMGKDIPPAANLRFMVGSDQTFPEDQYDIIVATDVIHWIKGKEEMFKRIYDNLKPGGKFGFTTSHNDGTPDLLIKIAQWCGPEFSKAIMDCGYFKPDKYYLQLASDVGFEVTFSEIRDREYIFSNFDAFVDFFYSVYHGKFNRTDPSLIEFKKNYIGKTVPWKLERLTVVLTKPLL